MSPIRLRFACFRLGLESHCGCTSALERGVGVSRWRGLRMRFETPITAHLGSATYFSSSVRAAIRLSYWS